MKKTAALLISLVLFVSCRSDDREIRAPGVVDGEIASVKAVTAGTLDRLLVREGQSVNRG